MKKAPPRSNNLAARERYLWLWHQFQLLDQRIQQVFNKSTSNLHSEPQKLWLNRVKSQIRRYWP